MGPYKFEKVLKEIVKKEAKMEKKKQEVLIGD